MSRTWGRVSNFAGAFCAYCRNRLIKNGDPALFIEIPGVKRVKVQCVDCSGPAPPDLPRQSEAPRLELTNFAESFKPVKDAMPTRTRGALKQAAREWMPHASDREVGEEG